MFRLCSVFVLALAAPTASGLEAHLRVHEDDIAEGLDVGKAKFSVDKSMNCEGGASMSKGMEQKCKAGMKQEFSAGVAFTDIASDIASELAHEMSGVLPTDMEAFLPSDMDDAAGFDEYTADSVEDGFSKSMSFGGAVKADWKCTVTYSKKRGEFSKKVECGFSSTETQSPMAEVVEDNTEE